MRSKSKPADAEKLLAWIGVHGWPGALYLAESNGWSDDKIKLLLEHLQRQGFIEIEDPEMN